MGVTLVPEGPADTPELRKARGAFFTPQPIVRFIADSALRDATDSLFEPSAGDAEFLVESVRRLRELSDDPTFTPVVHGVEIHKHSPQAGRGRVRTAGGAPRLKSMTSFVDSNRKYAAAIGNPPYLRYQDWSGDARLCPREAALRAGVSLTGLASSWRALERRIQVREIARRDGPPRASLVPVLSATAHPRSVHRTRRPAPDYCPSTHCSKSEGYRRTLSVTVYLRYREAVGLILIYVVSAAR
jgi:hypothetical protein